MLALDVARVEAGLLLTDVDFMSSRKASIAAQMYSPYELGLGRLVSARKASPFVGRAALARELAAGHRRQIVGLEVRWTEVEAIYLGVGLAPAVPAAASRVAVPSVIVSRIIDCTCSSTVAGSGSGAGSATPG